jgi:hypothetical protein
LYAKHTQIKELGAIIMNVNDLNKILKTYKSNDFIEYELSIEALQVLESKLEDLISLIGEGTLTEFIYWQIHRFNRFSVPTPFVLELNSKSLFNRYLNILTRLEKSNVNTACLMIDSLCWDAFDLILESAEHEQIAPIIRSLRNIKTPNYPSKTKEFNDHKRKLINYLNGFQNSQLQTIITTKIPVTPVIKKTRIKSRYKTRDVQITLDPIFYDTPRSFINTPNNHFAIPMSNSQWQNSVCDVVIKFQGLFDAISIGETLSITYGHDLPMKNWPSIFNETFNIIEGISWQLYDTNNKIGKWLVSPGDLGSIKWEVYNNQQLIESITKDPPSIITTITPEQKNEIEINLAKIDKEIPWFDKCIKIALNKLGAGDTNESIFWLNIGIEALFEIRSEEMLIENGFDTKELNSGASYWINAQELIAEQIPEILNTIQWPYDVKGVPSWYSKIKYLDKKIGLKQSKRQISSHYHKINKFRNELFHGNSSIRIKSSDVELAIKSYYWLLENFRQNKGA